MFRISFSRAPYSLAAKWCPSQRNQKTFIFDESARPGRPTTTKNLIQRQGTVVARYDSVEEWRQCAEYYKHYPEEPLLK